MKLTHTQYLEIASIIKWERQNAGNEDGAEVTWRIADHLADYFQSETPNFDREKFIEALK